MKFAAEQEGWNIYRFEDGTEVKVRVILVSVCRRDNQYHENGDPIYDLNFQQIVHMEAPGHLRAAQSAPTTITKQ